MKPLVPEEGEQNYNLSEWEAQEGAPDAWGLGGLQKGNHYLSDTGYSYLAPSVIELSTGIKGNNFIYRPRGFLATASQMDELYVALLNYSFNKEDEKNADLLDAPFSYDGLIPGGGPSLREIYKEVFEKLGMTVHDTALHDQFFLDAGHERESGAVSVDTPEAGFNVNTLSEFKFQYKIEDFSDAGLNPNTFFKNFASNEQVSIKKLKAYDLSSVDLLDTDALHALPNNFKITRIRNNHALADQPELATPTWYGPDNTYLFFNLNLTIKIEVFRGSTGNAKYDEDSWSLLTKEDLDNISGMLLCRMSYFDEKLTKDLNLPMLDKYFLINPGDAITGAAAVDMINQMTLITSPTDVPTFWAEQNEQTMQDYADSTGQGFDFGGGFQGTGAPTDVEPTYSTIVPGELLTGDDSSGVTPRSSTPSGADDGGDDYEAPLFNPKLVDY